MEPSELVKALGEVTVVNCQFFGVNPVSYRLDEAGRILADFTLDSCIIIPLNMITPELSEALEGVKLEWK